MDGGHPGSLHLQVIQKQKCRQEDEAEIVDQQMKADEQRDDECEADG